MENVIGNAATGTDRHNYMTSVEDAEEVSQHVTVSLDTEE